MYVLVFMCLCVSQNLVWGLFGGVKLRWKECSELHSISIVINMHKPAFIFMLLDAAERERQRDRERDRERQRETERDRERDRQRQTETDRDRER